MSGSEVTLSLSEREDLVHCRLQARIAAGNLGLSRGVIEGVVAALSEACANALTHGRDGESRATVTIRTLDDRLEMVIQDHGPGCPVRPDAPMPPPTEEYGRGIPLMNRLVDEVRIENEEGCRVVLIAHSQSSE